jgi:hypothetical protein
VRSYLLPAFIFSFSSFNFNKSSSSDHFFFLSPAISIYPYPARLCISPCAEAQQFGIVIAKDNRI